MFTENLKYIDINSDSFKNSPLSTDIHIVTAFENDQNGDIIFALKI